MGQITVAESARVPALPDVVYEILADYRDGHPAILPEKHFTNLTVIRGGVGEGTLIEFEFSILGQARTIRAEVSEWQPGRILTERDLDTDAITIFTVDPIKDRDASVVTIRTEWEKAGMAGFVERIIAPPILRSVYKKELQLLVNMFN